jgi:thiol-disulfide isomerase/thioredoxin
MVKHDLVSLREKTVPISDYLEGASKTTDSFYRHLNSYSLEESAVRGIEKLFGEAVVVVFSAGWCPDCHRNVPVLKLLSDETGLEVMVFGRLKKGDRSKGELWRVPPSPMEVADFEVKKIPLIVVLNQKGEKLGEIEENPPPGKTLESALLEILNDS